MRHEGRSLQGADRADRRGDLLLLLRALPARLLAQVLHLTEHFESLLTTLTSRTARRRVAQSTGGEHVFLEGQLIDHARLLEGALDGLRPGNQHAAVSLSFAETAAKRDHRHPESID